MGENRIHLKEYHPNGYYKITKSPANSVGVGVHSCAHVAGAPLYMVQREQALFCPRAQSLKCHPGTLALRSDAKKEQGMGAVASRRPAATLQPQQAGTATGRLPVVMVWATCRKTPTSFQGLIMTWLKN